MQIEYTKTNLFYMEEQYILHGVNCVGVMGAGVAKAIRSKFPEVYKEYKSLCTEYKDNLSELLGTVQAVESKDKIILNAFTQLKTGSGVQVDYNAVRHCFKLVNEKAKELGISRIGMPKLGAGLGGGDWSVIEQIITEESTNFIPVISEFTK